jgi:RNA polymerase sigma-70 factor (ECF subfamily)
MDHRTDAEIAARVLQGDKEAYSLLVDAYQGPLFNLALRMTGSYADADDLTQEIFFRAYQQLRKFNQEKHFFTWLYTIGINIIRNHIKKRNRDEAFNTAQRYCSESQIKKFEEKENDGLPEDRMIILEMTLRKLPIDVREAIILKYYQNMTFEEIAAITGDSTSAVKMRVYRGLEKIKQTMEKK